VPNNTLTEYIASARQQNLSDSVIKQNLISAGWDENSVNGALGISVPSPLTVPAPPARSSQSQTDSFWSWDSFEHVLLFLSFYTLIISIGITLYYFVDKLFPLAKTTYNYSFTSYDYSSSILSGVLSAIIVSFPLFSFFFLNIISRTKQNPELRHILARKRLIYITLIVTFIIMLQNLISVLNSFLTGNLVSNSLAHFVVIIGLSLVVFLYYLNLVSEDKYAIAK